MLIWVLAAVLTIMCCVSLFYSGRRGAVNGGDTEALTARIGVYKAQVAEIERDEVVGTISSFEAHSARAELARELLRQAEASDKGNQTSDKGALGADKGASGSGKNADDADLSDADNGQSRPAHKPDSVCRPLHWPCLPPLPWVPPAMLCSGSPHERISNSPSAPMSLPPLS
ncbi:MAG: c-type cytochrome biogenesis protein CcmI [Alphaproteobacteria bacterium]|nr:c-type cytochrome biogenesis protein CcmI [Alphaproteobacteria bacterium]